VQGCKANAQLRVFTLGIGESVSSDMCERLAREGGGKCKCKCLFAVQAEDSTEKLECAKLLNAGRTREIESVTIDWHGFNFREPTSRQFFTLESPSPSPSPSNRHRHHPLPRPVQRRAARALSLDVHSPAQTRHPFRVNVHIDMITRARILSLH
jgi:hypothetical protein